MKLVFIISTLLLTGCNQWRQVSITGTPLPKQEQVVAFGQSNMGAMNPLSSFQAKARVTAVYDIAVGGTHISYWVKGTPGYDSVIAQIKNGQYPTSCLLFWQGEEDAYDAVLAGSWAQNFTQMVRDLRADIGKDIPIIYVQLGPNTQYSGPFWDEVKAQQASVTLPKLYMVKAEDLQNDNSNHFVQSSYDIMQTRLATEYNNIMGN